MSNNVIKVGEYIVVQKHNYKKLYKFNKSDSRISVGKDSVSLSAIEGCNYFSIFKMVANGKKRSREYDLELVEETACLKDEIGIKSSGSDNRNIYDDGRSQKLTADEIYDLKSDSSKAADIVETLITNSNTFHNKTEFSQDKYLKKKEKKYFEYIQILKPNLRIISEILYKLEPTKVQGIRIDTLSQIVTMANLCCEGSHLLYDSGSNGLVAAALLNAIGDSNTGRLVHMHPGNMSQKQALLAMNYSPEQYNKCVSVNVYSALRQYYQGCDTNSSEKILEVGESNSLKRKGESVPEECTKIPKISETLNLNIEKTENRYTQEPKKPKWHFDNIEASNIISNKMDSLIIACKEDPQNIFMELSKFVKPGRPFVVYYPVAEPLQNLYVSLKSQSNVAALKLTCSWMRNYQILPERTHPEVLMNGSSGFLLTGYILK
ncbi:tRNA (adenine(58)-N(1))-methyltransferase non-catalytic subunit TRM6 [Pieris brassicae]|nr:tRNA (adenine(58)-N(1))-methyltransferase non-catalytic subunit TRM6 [Pieris brassicae]